MSSITNYSDLQVEAGNAARRQDRIRAQLLIAGFLVLGIGVAALMNLNAVSDLIRRWRYEEEYGYGPLVFGYLAYFLWSKRPTVDAVAPNGKTFLPIAVVVLGLILSIIGELGESFFLQLYGLMAMIFGLALSLVEANRFKSLYPVLVLMLFTVPLPYTLQAMLTVKLQLYSSEIGVGLVRALGIPVFLEGNVIDLGIYQLHVAEACSGLRYLLPFACIAFILGDTFQTSPLSRALVVLAAVPVTVTTNSLRIAVISVLVEQYGTSAAEGFLHFFEGWIVFLFGFLFLFLIIWGISRLRFGTFALAAGSDTVPQPNALRIGLTRTSWHSLAAIGVGFGLVLALHQFMSLSRNEANRTLFADFPKTIGDMRGAPLKVDPDVLAVLKATDTLSVEFKPAVPDEDMAPVSLFSAYYSELAREAAIHSPRVCLPGAGWEIASLETRRFPSRTAPTESTFYRVIIQKGSNRLLVYYWYQQRERMTASEVWMKWYLLRDRLLRGRGDGALVRLVTPILSNSAAETAAADRRLGDFALQLYPMLPAFVPK